jgi:hypothetical protein
MVALVVLAWVPWLISQFGDRPLINKGWGLYKSTIDPTTKKLIDLELFVSVDGSELQRYADHYRMIGIAFHDYGNQDAETITALQKSSEYYIESSKTIMLIPVSQTFIAEINRGDHGTNYVLMLLPEALLAADVVSLHQAKEMGAKIFGIGSGPP